MKRTFHVTGLKCQGCVDTVTATLSQLSHVEDVTVDFEKKQVTITGTAWKMTLNRALKGTAFRLGDEVIGKG